MRLSQSKQTIDPNQDENTKDLLKYDTRKKTSQKKVIENTEEKPTQIGTDQPLSQSIELSQRDENSVQSPKGDCTPNNSQKTGEKKSIFQKPSSQTKKKIDFSKIKGIKLALNDKIKQRLQKEQEETDAILKAIEEKKKKAKEEKEA